MFRAFSALFVFSLLSQLAPAAGYGSLPLVFEQNLGQADAKVNFLARAPGYTLFLTRSEALIFDRGAEKPIRMKWVGGDPHAEVRGLDRAPGVSNYLRGSDPANWIQGAPHYGRVEYRSVYSGIDLVFYGDPRRTEYDFIVRPGADPSLIQLDFGQAEVKLGAAGALTVQAESGKLALEAPVLYQEVGGRRRPVEGGFRVEDGYVGFEVGAYDHTIPLVIDPVVIYSTYLGGNATDGIEGIAVDDEFAAYVTGSTNSTNFPLESTLQGSRNGAGFSTDAFVAKLNASGSALIYSTYLGGVSSDAGFAIDVGPDGSAYVLGRTGSPDFPVTPGGFVVPGIDRNDGPGRADGFLTRVAPDGQSLLYSALVSDRATPGDVVVDPQGAAYFALSPSDAGVVLTTRGYINQPLGSFDGYVGKMLPDGSGLSYGTYLGGSALDSVAAIGIDAAGNAYVTGHTNSKDMLTTPGALQRTCEGDELDSCAFIVKLNALGSTAVYSTYFGGTEDDVAGDIWVEDDGTVYVAGDAESEDFALANSCPACAVPDANNFFWVLKLGPDGATPGYFIRYGSGGRFSGSRASIVVDRNGRASVLDLADLPAFPPPSPHPDALPVPNSGSDAFLATFNAQGSGFDFLTRIGGLGDGDDTEFAGDLAIDQFNNLYAAGATTSTDFPVERPLQATCELNMSGGCIDAFIIKFGERFTDIPILKVEPRVLQFSALEGDNQALEQGLRISNDSIIPVGWSADFEALSGDTDWLSITPDSGVTPFQLTVRANPANLPIGAYQGRVTVRMEGGGQIETIPVVLTIRPRGPVLSVNPPGLYFAAELGSGSLPPQTIRISNLGEGGFDWTASREFLGTEASTFKEWMTVDPAMGRVAGPGPGQASEITVNVDAGGQEPGRKTSVIRVFSDVFPTEPQFITVTLDVLRSSAPPPVEVTPGGLLFIGDERGGPPPAQLVTVYVGSTSPVGFSVSTSTDDQGDWLRATPTNASAKFDERPQIQITADATQLRAGEHRGRVDIAFDDGTSRYVPVAFVVRPSGAALSQEGGRVLQAGCVPTSLTVATVGMPGRFQAEVGVPQQHRVIVVDNCGNPVEGASVVATFGNGDRPQVLESDGEGRYSSTWTPAGDGEAGIETSAGATGVESGSASLDGSVDPGTQPLLAQDGVVNAASFDVVVAPGTIVTAFGRNLATGAHEASQVPLPTKLGGIQLMAGDQALPLFFANESQVNAQIPYEVEPGTRMQIYAVKDGVASTPLKVAVARAQPGVVQLNPALFGPDHIVALNQDGSVNTPENPAAPGSVTTIFLTGQGPVNPPIATGAAASASPLSSVTLPAVATIGGRPAPIGFLGMTPALVGLAQANLQIDERVASGPAAVKLAIGGAPANLLNLSVGGSAPPPPATGPDLSVELTALSPGSVGVGDPIEVSYTVRSTSPVSGTFGREIRISTDSQITEDDRLVTLRTFELTNGETSFVSRGNALPRDIAPGDYFIGVMVTAEGDPNPSNNTSMAMPLTVVAERAPFDLGVSIDSVDPMILAPGEPFSARYTITNFSSSTGAYWRWLYVSTDRNITTEDTLVNQRFTRLSGESLAVTTTSNLTPNLSPGAYFLGVIVEPGGDSDPGDNISPDPVPITITGESALSSLMPEGATILEDVRLEATRSDWEE